MPAGRTARNLPVSGQNSERSLHARSQLDADQTSAKARFALQAIVYINKTHRQRHGAGWRGTLGGFTAQAMLDTPPVRVLVRPLPDSGRRRGFTGAIGKFDLGQPQLSANEVQVGDPLTLTVTISGTGNLEAISPPLLDGPRRLAILFAHFRSSIATRSMWPRHGEDFHLHAASAAKTAMRTRCPRFPSAISTPRKKNTSISRFRPSP